jgi:hypothetical protein
MRLTKRGKIVAGVLVALAIAGIYYMATHVWWVGGGWCFDTLTECLIKRGA